MKPCTVGKAHNNIGKVVPVQCVDNDALQEIQIKDNCFLMLIISEGNAYFEVGSVTFEAIAPCLVCFDERVQPKLLGKSDLQCNAIYFHPEFLNENMSFETVHGGNYEQVALVHDIFLLRPFTDQERYVFSMPVTSVDYINGLFAGMNKELEEQPDWYWSCRSRSLFMEMILVLERLYGIKEQNQENRVVNTVENIHLKKAVMFIESQYQKRITLGSIVRAVSLNHNTLTQLFKQYLGVTPIEYLWQYRINVAKKYLEFTDLPVKEIARRCGFKTVQHFCHKFEACTNSTPTSFRKHAVDKRKMDFVTMI